jgi:microtubule-associated protein-like 6
VHGRAYKLRCAYHHRTHSQVYNTAGVGVVYQRPPLHCQHFFLGHTNDITALALCPAAVDVSGQPYPARTLVASGQVRHAY